MSPEDLPLVDAIAELKMIRTLQMRVNKRTDTYAKLLSDPEHDVGQATDQDLLESLDQLSQREQRIHQITRDIILERNQSSALSYRRDPPRRLCPGVPRFIALVLAVLALLSGGPKPVGGRQRRSRDFRFLAASSFGSDPAGACLTWLATQSVDESQQEQVRERWNSVVQCRRNKSCKCWLRVCRRWIHGSNSWSNFVSDLGRRTSCRRFRSRAIRACRAG